jgi:hypothetical protein
MAASSPRWRPSPTRWNTAADVERITGLIKQRLIHVAGGGNLTRSDACAALKCWWEMPTPYNADRYTVTLILDMLKMIAYQTDRA